jgi:hypothetical protein
MTPIKPKTGLVEGYESEAKEGGYGFAKFTPLREGTYFFLCILVS